MRDLRRYIAKQCYIGRELGLVDMEKHPCSSQSIYINVGHIKRLNKLKKSMCLLFLKSY